MGRAFEYRRAAKEARWGKMSRIFPKLGKAITMAAKEGGPDHVDLLDEPEEDEEELRDR